MTARIPRLGAWRQDGLLHFRTWAPTHGEVELALEDGRNVAMQREPHGLWSTSLRDEGPLPRYRYRLDGEGPWPDPLSRAQPDGVQGASALDSQEHAWQDAQWRGLAPEQLVIWEAHVGTATPEGTFDALITRLDHLRDLGITALELMPVATFPGRRNWGYDGTFWFAPAACYGGPEGLRRLVDAAHAKGLAVILDVVFNHFGPEGNWLWLHAREAFTDRHRTPWGEAIDYTKPVMREIALSCVEHWIRDYHLDGLRLDATHAIHDDSGGPHLLQEIGERARTAGGERRVVVIAEDDRNEARLVRPIDERGFALDAVWADDFHHAMRVLLTGERDGYFADYEGTAQEVVHALNRGWIYEGAHSGFRNEPRGTSPEGLPPSRMVHCLQNHDQVGNRALGDRLSTAIESEAIRAASALLLLSPHVPLLFMGEEWQAQTPFRFFTDHPPELGRLVTEGRRKEFASFAAFGGEVPDPQDEETFRISQLDWSEKLRPAHAEALAWHRALLELRHTHPALRRSGCTSRVLGERAVAMERGILVVASFANALQAPLEGSWRVLLSSDERRFGGRDRLTLGAGTLQFDAPGALVLEPA